MASLLDLNLEAIRVTTGNTDRNGLTYHNVSLHEGPVRFKLFPHPLGTEVRREPVATRNEQRLDVFFQLDAPRRKALARLETIVRERIGFTGTWNSSVKNQDCCCNIKAKIILDGAKATAMEGLPDLWPQLAFGVLLQLHTAYTSTNFGGLIIETVAVDFKPRDEDTWQRHWSFTPASSRSRSRFRFSSGIRGPLDRYFRQPEEEA